METALLALEPLFWKENKAYRQARANWNLVLSVNGRRVLWLLLSSVVSVGLAAFSTARYGYFFRTYQEFLTFTWITVAAGVFCVLAMLYLLRRGHTPVFVPNVFKDHLCGSHQAIFYSLVSCGNVIVQVLYFVFYAYFTFKYGFHYIFVTAALCWAGLSLGVDVTQRATWAVFGNAIFIIFGPPPAELDEGGEGDDPNKYEKTVGKMLFAELIDLTLNVLVLWQGWEQFGEHAEYRTVYACAVVANAAIFAFLLWYGVKNIINRLDTREDFFKCATVFRTSDILTDGSFFLCTVASLYLWGYDLLRLLALFWATVLMCMQFGLGVRAIKEWQEARKQNV